MSRYIDADEALRMMRNSKEDNPCELPLKGIWNTAHECCISCVDAVPTVDAVEVVRCKDCEHYEAHGNGKAGLCKNKKCKRIRYENDFCCDGERR